MDARDATSVDAAVGQAALALGGIDASADLVGFMKAAQAPPAVRDEVVRCILNSTFLLSHAVLPYLHAFDRASLVHTACELGARARPSEGPYGSAKAVLILLMRQLTLEKPTRCPSTPPKRRTPTPGNTKQRAAYRPAIADLMTSS